MEFVSHLIYFLHLELDQNIPTAEHYLFSHRLLLTADLFATDCCFVLSKFLINVILEFFGCRV